MDLAAAVGGDAGDGDQSLVVINGFGNVIDEHNPFLNAS